MDSSSNHRKRSTWLPLVIGVITLAPFLLFVLIVLARLMLLWGILKIPNVYERFPNTIWVSSNPEICCVIPESIDKEDASYIVINGERKDVSIQFAAEPSSTVYICYRPKRSTRVVKVMLSGEWRIINSKELMIEVWPDDLFDGEYKTITLIRQE